MKAKWSKKLKAAWLWVRPILITVILVLTAKSVLADWYHVPTGSMKPTVVEGDRLFVNKLAYGLRLPFSLRRMVTWSAPARGEIIVFYPPGEERCFVKRVIGVPGDRVAMQNNTVYVNGEQLDYEPIGEETAREIAEGMPLEEGLEAHFFSEDLQGLKHAIMITPQKAAARTFGPVTVPAGHYFVMGDNRDNSSDSRFWGFVSENNVIGKAGSVIISFDRSHYYLPRRSRFFRSLYEEQEADSG